MTDRISKSCLLNYLTPSIKPAKRTVEPDSDLSTEGTNKVPKSIDKREKDTNGIDPARAPNNDGMAPQLKNISESKNRK